jgi:dTDP-4-amino-4,6-dideoxygalactose transaminase
VTVNDGTATESVSVPFVDLGLLHAPIDAELQSEIAELVDSGRFVNGPQIAAFEEAFAAWCGAAHCVGTASGLDALRLALVAIGIEPGDEVVVPAMTFVATAEAVTQAGGRPVLADISEGDWNLDPAAAAAAVSDRTRVLLPVHLYGQMADLGSLADVARRHDLALVEDACQAHGAERDGARAGTVGLASAFSFYPAKNLGAMGDAGAVVTSDGALAELVRVLREHGQRRKYHHDVEGWTSRLDTIQAVVLLLKLPSVAAGNDDRRRAAAFYDEALAGVGDLVTPPVPAGSTPVWHLYVVRTADPEALGAHLARRGVSTGRHYPVPVHLTGAYERLGYGRGAFPAAEALGDECLSLPIFPGITEDQLETVTAAVGEYFARRG